MMRGTRGGTYFVAVFWSFHGLPLVRPAEDCASSRGAEVDASGVEMVVVDMMMVDWRSDQMR